MVFDTDVHVHVGAGYEGYKELIYFMGLTGLRYFLE